MTFCVIFVSFFFFNDTATTEIYTLSLHDALPICQNLATDWLWTSQFRDGSDVERSEEHTSELQSRFGISYAVFCLKKKHTYTAGMGAGRKLTHPEAQCLPSRS